MISYMYRLKGRRGIFIHPSHTDGQEVSYLLGHGEENSAELQTYHYSIPQTVSDYSKFTADMKYSEVALKSQFQLKI